MNTDREHSEQKTKQSRWGFRGMTVRDWLQLLIVPLVLVVIGFLFTAQQAQRQQRNEDQRAQQAQKIENHRAEADRELAEQRAQDEALQAYLDQMSSMMLNKNLLKSEQGDPIHTLAQARTATVITRLDAAHNKDVMNFLRDSGLAGKKSSIALLRDTNLNGANLSGADLENFDLSEATLEDVDLTGADLSEADLAKADLRGAKLSNAVLWYADLSGATLYAADLDDATLTFADLSGATLTSLAAWERATHVRSEAIRLNLKLLFGVDPKDAPDLSGADLRSSNLSNALLSGADLSYADLSYADLSNAKLRGANLRDARLGDRDNLGDADLTGVDLTGADLSGAVGITNEELEQARSLEGATMPNGQKYEDWLKDQEGSKKGTEND